ncbi:MAG TPA: hypothetical protein VEW46_21425 [Pyrinomonadaceae bacterium]|nr:hypothetical protein [Pyrinomonadaceae bacterium]
MAATEKSLDGSEDSRRKLIIVVAIIAALVIAVFFYFLMRASSTGGIVDPVLESAIRQGSPEWDQNYSKIVLDQPEADEAKRALGDIVMNLQTTVRNFTGRTLNGLEIRGTVVDSQDKPVRERTLIVIPTRQPELGPNQTMVVAVRLEGMKESDNRANIKMEVTGFRFKQ